MSSDEERLGTMPEFSLVKGGLLFHVLRSLRLSDEGLGSSSRRIFAFVGLTWVPMLLLSIICGRSSSGVDVPFLSDVENHARFLVALPLLLAAETLVDRLTSPRIRSFIRRNIVRDKDLPKFYSAIRSASRMRDSWAAELALLAGVYAAGSYFYGNVMASASGECSTWYATPASGHWNLTLAGNWLVFVSLPVFQFIFVRWYYRFLIWTIFLWRVTRLDLRLLPTHSDRVAGLGFLNKCAYSFSYWMIAQGAVLSGYIAGQVVHFGADPSTYKLEAAGVVVLVLFLVLGPVALFAPRLLEAKWERGAEFGHMASRYVQDFNSKWIHGHNQDGEELLGTTDIQSLADLGNSHSVIDQTRTVPFSTADILYMSGMTLAPLIPLLFFIFSLEALLEHVLKILL